MSNLEEYDGQSAQSAEFFKIKLMERDSQLTTMEAKIKKMQFKQARQLKQLKIQIDRAKDLLKQQKSKLDKVSKSAAELQQQNSLLQTRLADLKQQKDREVQSVRSKYNQIKEEVRQYERILPTHTFITELGATIEQLPTYEELFMNLKEKSQLLQQNQQKFSAYRLENQEKLKSATKAVEITNEKKGEVQRNMKEVVTKNVDLEAQLANLRNKEEQIYRKMLESTQQIQRLHFKVSELEDQNKEYKEKVEEIVHNYHVDIKAKQQQITKLTEHELNKYETELGDLQNRHQQREGALLNQLTILDEDVSGLQTKLQKDRERYEDMLNELRNQLQQLKHHEEDLKKGLREADQRAEDTAQKLVEICERVDKDQQRLANAQKQTQNLTEQLNQYKNRERTLKQTYKQTIGAVNQQKKELTERVQQLEQDLMKAVGDKKERQNQIAMLSHEVDDLKGKYEYSEGRKISMDKIPSQFDMEIINRKSSLEAFEENSPTKPRKSFGSLPTIPVIQANSQTEFLDNFKTQNISEDLSKFQDTIKQLQQNKESLEHKLAKLESKLKTEAQKNYQMKGKIQNHEKQLFQLNEKMKQLEVANKTLKRQAEEAEQQAQSVKKKMWIYKQQYDKLVGDQEKQVQENLKEKQTKNALNKQIRELKGQIEELKNKSNELEFEIKKLKDVKEKYEQLKAKNVEKEKVILGQNEHLKLDMEQFTREIAILKEKIAERDQQQTQKKQQIEKLREQMDKLEQQKIQKEEQLNLKIREIQMLKESLGREQKERTLRIVPSLKFLDAKVEQEQEQFTKHYNLAGEKEAEKYLLERQISDLKEDIEGMKRKQANQLEGMEAEQNQYIQEIIKMKLKCAEVDLRASEKQFLYCQMKKKMETLLKAKQA